MSYKLAAGQALAGLTLHGPWAGELGVLASGERLTGECEIAPQAIRALDFPPTNGVEENEGEEEYDEEDDDDDAYDDDEELDADDFDDDDEDDDDEEDDESL
jgi:hypothetical protein